VSNDKKHPVFTLITGAALRHTECLRIAVCTKEIWLLFSTKMGRGILPVFKAQP
jgi:hypothetical protein